MANPIRQQQVASLLRQTLGEIFIQETPRLFGRVMITVISVQMASNLSFAKVNLSFMLTDDKKALLKSISQHKSEIKGLLGRRLGSKLRRIPEIEFHIDTTIEKVFHMERLMNSLDLSASKEATSTES
jgi:ribosome-binding factor A